MHPRDFLKLAGATLIGLTQSTFAKDEGASSDSTKKQILIIGAGLTGLAAARELKSLRHDVIIFEARDRIGGRIWTSKRWDDLPADFGATWIHGVTDNPLTEIADQTSAKRLTTSYNRSVTYGTEGKPLTESDESIRKSLRKRIFRVLKAAQAEEPDRSIREAVRPLMKEIEQQKNAAVQQKEAAAKVTLNLLNFILSGEIEQEYAGSAEKLSAH
jgi:monoamine oxidase